MLLEQRVFAAIQPNKDTTIILINKTKLIYIIHTFLCLIQRQRRTMSYK